MMISSSGRRPFTKDMASFTFGRLDRVRFCMSSGSLFVLLGGRDGPDGPLVQIDPGCSFDILRFFKGGRSRVINVSPVQSC